MRALIGVDFGDGGRIVINELLVHKSEGRRIDQNTGDGLCNKAKLTPVCDLPVSHGGLEGEADRVQRGVDQHRASRSRIRRR